MNFRINEKNDECKQQLFIEGEDEEHRLNIHNENSDIRHNARVRAAVYSQAGCCQFCKYGRCSGFVGIDNTTPDLGCCKGCPNAYGAENLCHCKDTVYVQMPQCPYFKD